MLAKRRQETQRDGAVFGFNRIKKNDLTLRLANIWGFCYGVLYALEEVSRILESYPDRRIWVLGDLIHNPLVNQELQNLGAKFIELDEIDRVQPDDLVVIPAFGTKKEILTNLQEREVKLINTTCPEVQTVEERVKEFNQKGYTVIIHGKYSHQETIATCSYADSYLIVRNLEEAQYVCDYILGNGERKEFLSKFKDAIPADFDPDEDLERIGLANQTTMLMNDSLQIFNLFENTIKKRDGNLDNFLSIDTICSATQDRQDAVKNLISENDFDLFIVVGGHNSSNTQNLARTVESSADIPVYHIEEPDDFNRQQITFLPPGEKEEQIEQEWLPAGEINLGITAGASTPHSQLESVIKKLLSYY